MNRIDILYIFYIYKIDIYFTCSLLPSCITDIDCCNFQDASITTKTMISERERITNQSYKSVSVMRPRGL